MKWKESLLKEREIFLYVCFSVLSIAMCVSETNKRICMVCFRRGKLHGTREVKAVVA